MKKSRLLGAALTACLFLISNRANALSFEITDLGDWTGGLDFSVATGINENGQVSGYGATSSGRRAFVWNNGSLVDLGLPTGYGSANTFAYDINDNGSVVGYIATGQGVGFVWRNGVMTALDPAGTFNSNYYSSAYAINNTDQIIGNGTSSTRFDTLIWDASGVNGLNTGVQYLGGGINDAGQVVVGNNLWENGIITPLPGGISAEASSINAAGVIAGTVSFTNHPYIGLHAGILENGSWIDLGATVITSGSTTYSRSFGFAINDNNWVVGHSGASIDTDSRTDNRAFLWTQTDGFIDLNDLVDPADGWTIVGAQDVNNNGLIAATGFNGSAMHALLLTPTAIPTPPALWLFGSGLLGLIGVARRKHRE